MTKRLLVLIPPSLGKSRGGRQRSKEGVYDVVLDEPRRQVLDALRNFVARATTRELEITFNAKGELLERAVGATNDVVLGRALVAPAWRRYEGIVWNHLEPSTLTPGQRRRVLIPSGLYGLLSCEDSIADYRLRMNVRLKPLPSLAQFWRPIVTPLLVERAKNDTIVNFLPQEHAASVDFHSLAQTHHVVHVHFVANDEQRAVGHDAKAVKGILARYVLTEGLDAIESVDWRGWRVHREGSDVIVAAP
ncbi:MAG TPA: peroxide stress protein YaaA [Acidimicrobiales bacterium]|nr:peroxide stress protein YaaA [Acidimicrobiales bacterium]